MNPKKTPSPVLIFFKKILLGKRLPDKLPAYRGSSSLRFSPNIHENGFHFMSKGKTGKLRVAYNTTVEEFDAYVDKLKTEGYKIEYENAIEDNKYIAVANEKSRFYIYFTKSRGSVTFVTDTYSVPLSEFSYTTDNVADGEGAQFWHYGLNQDPGGWSPTRWPEKNTSGYPDSGQLQVIKCADDSLIIIDSGGPDQCDYDLLDRFLHHIAGKDIDEKVTVSAWYFTHPHGDHVKGARRILPRFHEKYDVQRIMSNLYMNKDSDEPLGTMFREYYPDCKEIKLHTGQTIHLSDVTLQIMYTHEDTIVNETGLARSRKNSNDSCTVMKVITKDMSIMVLGDINLKAEKIIVEAFPKDALKSDVVQVAHHGWNWNLKPIYEKVNANILLFTQIRSAFEDPNSGAALMPQRQPQPEKNQVGCKPHYDWLMQNFSSGGAYFSGSYEFTSGLVFKNGKIEALPAPKL